MGMDSTSFHGPTFELRLDPEVKRRMEEMQGTASPRPNLDPAQIGGT
jgi:hypothetical protein